MVHAISQTDFDRLSRLDTCTVSNVIERLNVRLRNEGFAHDATRCFFPRLGPMLGYAVTATIRSSTQPITGGWYYDRLDWWQSFLAIPAPRVVVLQDVDRVPAFGAFIGEIHANIARALGCVGCVTNGAVRDVPAMDAIGFHVFAGGVSPSHAYAHVIEWGQPVEIGGLKIHQGDLVQGDCHGVQVVPTGIAADIPDIAEALRRREQELVDVCRAPNFSLDVLASALDRLRGDRTESHVPTPSQS
ncbi:MAG TPA: RraA family protein [Vicinamibacterales bacterium]|nr:RraA family protein [Vicinamibacterales bacterium]